MTKVKRIPIIYNPEKSYDTSSFENATVKNLYVIAKQLGVRDVKKCNKHNLIELILSKHTEKQVTLVLNDIVDVVVNKTQCLESVDILSQPEIESSFNDEMKQKFKSVVFYKINQNVWFHANSIAEYLHYKDCRSAIYKNVLHSDKMCYDEIMSRLKEGAGPSFGTFHPQTVFINRSGIFDLIMKSSMPMARQFRDWLIDDVLPSIMNTGAYISPQLNNEQLKELQTKLEETITKNNELQLQLQNASSNQYNKVHMNLLTNHDYKMEKVYIITSKDYARNYIFKIGKSIDPFKRLPSLNTGMIKDSTQLYICYVHDCIESIHVEKHIHCILRSYRYKHNREFFVIQYHVLQKLIDICCKKNNSTFEDFQKLIEDENKQLLPEFSTFIPAPYHISKEKSEDDNNTVNPITKYFTLA